MAPGSFRNRSKIEKFPRFTALPWQNPPILVASTPCPGGLAPSAIAKLLIEISNDGPEGPRQALPPLTRGLPVPRQE